MNLLIFNALSWEQRKLGDIAKFINGRAYAQNELLPSGKYKVLRVGNFYTNDSWYYSDLELDDKYYANDGDLLYTWSATFGPHIWRGDRVIYHYHIWKIDLTDELEKHFAVQLLEQDKNDILSGHNGSTMAHITKEGMEQKEVVIPKNIGEQRQLGLFFDNLDNLITLHQSTAESWKNKKNQLSTISWEQRKVGDITIESTEYTTLDAEYPLLTSSRAGLMYQNEYRGNLTTDSKETLFSVVPIGACTYRHMSDDDVFHLNINTLEKGLVSREYPVFFATKENCLNFIIQYINSSASFRAFCAEQKKGGTRTRLYYNALCEFKMMVPSKREQEVIAGYLLSLDHLITLHQKQWFILKKLQFSPGSNSPVAA